ncbi:MULTISPECIES: TonB-dependent receptor [Parabacteroides]|jgi:TonB-linked SusC/RagA family outer membrane protein|uniref:TonB-dependent receptor n=1 Tax=Parabacteroides TaxID=375288 RepID=UPI00202DF925|nr:MULTISPECIES: TonB-dependent receptor [unclassified Parabacteroides]MCM0711964.1 TonB-dependent receptor [Parabacteroides sp. TA-V-105]
MKIRHLKKYPTLQKVLKRDAYRKLFLCLFLGMALNVSANSSIFEQKFTLNLSFKNAKIEQVLDAITKQSGIKIAYNNDEIATNKSVSVNIKTSDIEDALEAVLGNGYTFKQIDDYIAIARKEGNAEKATPSITQQKDLQIKGLITDADGNPIIGATVAVKGTTTGVITDIDGQYVINAPKGCILEFRYIGYNTEEKEVKNDNPINIRMMESSVGLEDVVVIGYGQQKKESVVASINTISAKELSMPTRSLTNNLAGQISGILAVQRSGQPGKDDSEFWIRGVSSFAGGTSPLVLVDGVPRSMSDIGVDEIESFTVLKDASATAVYGAEGANGVVLITSKRGTAQKPTLDIRAEFSVAKPTRLPKMMGSYDHLSLYNEAVWESKGNPTSFVAPYSDDVLEMYRSGIDPDLYPNADFTSLLKDNTQNQRVTLNLRGGSERVKYFVSGAFYNENGIFDSQAIDKYDANIGLSRYNIRSNVDINVTKTTDLSVDMSGQYMDSSYPAKDVNTIFTNIYAYAPYLFPLRFSDGKFAEHPQWNGSSTENPYNMLNESGYQKNWDAFIQSKITLNQKLDFITKGLSLKLTGSFDANYASITKRTKSPTSYTMKLNENGEKEYVQINEGQPNLSDHANDAASGKTGRKQIYLEASLNYTRTFNELHDVAGMVLYMQKDRQDMGSGLPYKKQSVVARTSYGFDNRYLAEASFGLTGSENFAKGYRYGIFPSVGLAWYVSNEAFMKNAEDIINKLKIRASYGLTGNDNVGGSRFPYRGVLVNGAEDVFFGFNGGSGGKGVNSQGKGLIEGIFSAPYLSWEVEEKKNIGLDLGLLRGRIDISVDFFKNDRRDILMQRKTISSVTGFRQNPWQNYGKVSNKGIDGNIVIKQKVQQVNLSFRGNITYAKNKVIEYDEVKQRYDYQAYTGHSLGTPKLYIAEGLYTDNDFIITENPSDGSKNYTLKEGLAIPSGAVMPGDIKYTDLNNDKKIDSYDQTYNHGFYAQNPEWVYGFGLNAEYKGFYAGIFFQGVANASINLNGGRFVPFSGGLTGSTRVESVDHWSSRNPENHNVLYPRLHPEQFSHNTMGSTWWYRNGNFIRLKNLEFGYQFNPKTLQKALIKNARLYVQGNNIAVWDHIKMWDPELGSAGGGSKYPISMTWTVGLELGF